MGGIPHLSGSVATGTTPVVLLAAMASGPSPMPSEGVAPGDSSGSMGIEQGVAWSDSVRPRMGAGVHAPPLSRPRPAGPKGDSAGQAVPAGIVLRGSPPGGCAVSSVRGARLSCTICAGVRGWEVAWEHEADSRPCHNCSIPRKKVANAKEQHNRTNATGLFAAVFPIQNACMQGLTKLAPSLGAVGVRSMAAAILPLQASSGGMSARLSSTAHTVVIGGTLGRLLEARESAWRTAVRQVAPAAGPCRRQLARPFTSPFAGSRLLRAC